MDPALPSAKSQASAFPALKIEPTLIRNIIDINPPGHFEFNFQL